MSEQASHSVAGLPGPSNFLGFTFFLSGILLTSLGIYLSAANLFWVWLSGQGVLAFALLQWFVILHEAAHKTLFRSPLWNRLSGYIAALFALIPAGPWRIVHDRHHLWTGWQDIDSTTADLVHKPGALKKWAVITAWATSLPLFSILYRTNNYWNYFRIRKFVEAENLNSVKFGILFYLVLYSVLIYMIGFSTLTRLFGAALFFCFMMEDPILLSQHTHIPQYLSGGKRVEPFPHGEQGRFTRSLRFPFWFSRFILHFDAHELHHKYVAVPGYYLRSLSEEQPNEVHWWRWLRAAKRLRGDRFLFLNSDHTGFRL